ncbi:hypothetical protein [Moorena sp. SIO4G3]|uniref:hypothetical protein n=1 Tax=Moorena sp. SIO4G3 TaxID=2607821 RepID=UPI0014299BC9|nr:hypothetical protein [Moorena sp. SIO4G3]NEO80791.1 hypothetical protein [Moorena sp. SIO4G3]
MNVIKIGSFLSLGIIFALTGNRVSALPGQRTDQVAAWINGHPTLRPGIGDGLVVRKSDTAGERFTFQATVLPPGSISYPKDRSTIRSERIAIHDQVNGVTLERLEESLRTVYGPQIYRDYNSAQFVYTYPSREILELSRRKNLPLWSAEQGKLLLGEKYGYWIEITQNDSGKAFIGQLTVFLKEDLGKLETELRAR